MRAPLVSIMMPAYNAEKFIGQAIASVLDQSYSQWELVIVNDGSTDSTGELIARHTDPRIQVIHQPNAGEAAARNRALGVMQGELIAFLDADDLFLPHHLEVTVGYLRAHPGQDAVYTDGFHCDPDGNRLAPLSSRRRGPFEGTIFEEVVRASDVFGPPTCVVLRRHRIVEHGLQFDEGIVIGPDWDFLVHYAAHGRFGYVPEKTCLYRVHDTNVTFRVDGERRAASLARCREKAIKLPGFAGCSPEVRTAVFYDLLINLLSDASRMAAVVSSAEFLDLPAAQRARLLRLMAGRVLVEGESLADVHDWLRQARAADAHDWRAFWLSWLIQLNPPLCRRLLLRFKQRGHARRGNELSLEGLRALNVRV